MYGKDSHFSNVGII